ncbi:unannotated protein [freshwater metagenome]|uniref:Unannotated protein n=1 Tax=freshwater metagenome TaxID=449393 RepID=A0A6J6XB48_9ZZZZ
MQMRTSPPLRIPQPVVVAGTVRVGAAAPVVHCADGVVPQQWCARNDQHRLVLGETYPAMGAVGAGEQVYMISGEHTVGDRHSSDGHLLQAPGPAQHATSRRP